MKITRKCQSIFKESPGPLADSKASFSPFLLSSIEKYDFAKIVVVVVFLAMQNKI